MAVALAALLAFTGLVLNVGLYLVERRHLQNAADAAALAATIVVAEEQQSRSLRDAPVSSAVLTLTQHNNVAANRQVVASYVDASGSPLSPVGGGGQFLPTATGVHVVISGPFATILGGFVGTDTIQVQTYAEARLVRLAFPATRTNVAPLAIPLSAFESAASYDLYDQTVANSAYGVTGFQPFVDLAHGSNTGAGYTAATSYGDLSVNLQYWSDGLHATGEVGIGSRLAIAAGSAASIRAGLLDNVRRQGLTDGSGQRYALVNVLLWDAYLPRPTATEPDRVQVAGYAAFKILQSNIGLTSLPGHFVPTLAEPPLPAPTTGVLWGPGKVALVK